MINAVVADEELMPEALKLASRLASARPPRLRESRVTGRQRRKRLQRSTRSGTQSADSVGSNKDLWKASQPLSRNATKVYRWIKVPK